MGSQIVSGGDLAADGPVKQDFREDLADVVLAGVGGQGGVRLGFRAVKFRGHGLFAPEVQLVVNDAAMKDQHVVQGWYGFGWDGGPVIRIGESPTRNIPAHFKQNSSTCDKEFELFHLLLFFG
ncbi:MAG: hypothetical protein U1F87_13905 [Kiritimatiellia bacterium]